MHVVLLLIALAPMVCAFSQDPSPQNSVPETTAQEQKTVIQGFHVQGKAEEKRLCSYIQGALDVKYPDSLITVSIQQGNITLSHMPQNQEECQNIATFVQALLNRPSSESTAHKISLKTSPGLWFPQMVLYPSQVANPRQTTFAAGLRISDKILGRWAAPVAIGDQVPVYRWRDVFQGDLQAEIEACVFATFNLSESSYPLINTDYYVGIPFTYARDNWRGRLRVYHLSSHLGDEFLLQHHHHHIKRKNKSFEAVDASCAYYVLPEWYFFATLGSVVASDNEMPVNGLYVEYGFEVRGQKKQFTQLFRQPFLSVFLRNSQDNNLGQDLSIALGYEWGKIINVEKLFRAFLEYHQGYSAEGQFSHKKTNYLGLKFSYGF